MASRSNILPPTHEKSLEVYFKDINRFQLLTREEEADLARRIHEGDEAALRHLVNANLRFVVTVAKRYLHQGLSLADLINEGNIGLLKAADRFDETRGFKFISYAVWWIRQSILQSLLDHSRLVRLPQNQTAQLLKINRVRSRLQSEGFETPSPDVIGAELGISPDEVRRSLELGGGEVGLDDLGTGDRPLVETLSSDEEPGSDARLYERVLCEDVRKSLETLNEREAVIISLYYGLGDEDAMTLEAIGNRLGLTRERIRQIKEKALRKMRQTAGRAVLKDYA
jgi:RNA polymerase primary sigma factor